VLELAALGLALAHLAWIRHRDRGQQGLRVLVFRSRVHVVGRTDLDDLAEVHDGDTVAHPLDHRKVVGDEEVREEELLLKILEQVEDLGLDRDVEGGDGLVADDELGLDRQRTGDGEALTLSRDELEARMHESKGFAAEGSGGEFAILETTLSPELVLEGQARELVHQIQNLRRDAGLAVDDRIVVVHDGSLEPLLKAHRAYIARETLAVDVAKDEKLASLHNLRVAELRLDGEKVRVGIRPAGKK